MIRSLMFLCYISGGVVLSEAAEFEQNTRTQTITAQNFSLPNPYRAYSADGIDHDLDHLVLTISTFSKKGDGSYQFLSNNNYHIRLADGGFQSQNTENNAKISAIGMAFEIHGRSSNLVGPVPPIKRITALDQLVFDFVENVAVKELKFVMKMVGEYTLKVKLIARLNNGQEVIYKKMGDVFDSKNAILTTPLSSVSSGSFYNIFWKTYLNDKNKMA